MSLTNGFRKIHIDSKTKSRIPLGIEKSYFDPFNQREEIRKDTNAKIGIYAWENKINNKIYIGSGDPLYLRLSDYYQRWYLESKNNLYIVRSLNKYSMKSFNLHILEYSNSENVIKQEQKWIDLISPEYNTNLIAGSSKGYKHTEESIEKMKISATGRKHSDEVKESMSMNRRGTNNSFYNKKHSPETIEILKEIAQNRTHVPVKGLEVEITDLETKITSTHSSIREAARFLQSDIKIILRSFSIRKRYKYTL
uniref:GIY-YIG endonuclease n=1 Tax=Metarhizium rileyi (strain RCEF 4871) TaxID=1649241 RepID=A0A6H0B7E4_METRR|nr:GIY-YIG endonuclease [Metarhizium rileyi]QIS49087.1 GIY-YIG endonuclease [Metarhizium rileyi]